MDEKIILKPMPDYLCDMEKEIEPGKTYLCESGSNYVIELKLTCEQIQKGYHSGDCDSDIEELMQVPEIESQLDTIDDDLLTKWWDEVFLDGLPKTPVSEDKHQALSWLVFECCSNAIDGYCYEMR